MTDNPSSSNNWSFGRSLLLLLISFDLLAVAIWLVVYHSYYQAVTEVVGGIWGAVVAFLGYLKIKTSRTKSLPEFLGLLPVKMTILAYTILIVIFMSFYLLAQFPVHTVLVTATLNGRPQGGVEIFWDNARKGRTGNDGLLKISSVTRGHHDLRAALEGFPEETKEKIFVGAGLKLSVEVEFDSARILKGNLFVDSNPRGAEIFINGKKKEGLRTPTLIYDLPARLHQLTLAKDGYLPRQVEVKIPVEDTASIVVQLSKLPSQPEPTGAIHLTSNPSGAEIYLDGKRLKGQQTPVLIPGLPVGTHYLELRKFHPERETYGYRAKGQIQIRAGHTSNVRMDLELQELCELYVLSDPEGAEIYVNDEESFRGITPLTILLFSGTSYIRLRKEGYQEKAKQVTLIEPRGNVERFTLSQL